MNDLENFTIHATKGMMPFIIQSRNVATGSTHVLIIPV